MDDSTDSQLSWYFSDKGIGSSLDEVTTSSEFSYPDNFEREVYGLHILRERLLQEDVKLEQILKQIQKGKDEFDEKRLTAEKAVLTINLKTKLLLDSFRHHLIGEENNIFYRIGSVTVSNTKLHFVEKNTIISYFICTLTSDSMLFMSQICKPNSEGVIDFCINHTFCNLPPDFKISLKIYILQVKKPTFWQKIKKKFKRVIKSPPLHTEGFWKRESFFKFWKEVELDIRNTNKTNEFLLEIFNSQLVKITTEATANLNTTDFSYKGWLDMSRNNLFWNQKWCVLNGSKLNCYNYPVDNYFNSPVTSVDLFSCTSARIERRVQQTRRRILVLDMLIESVDPLSYYFTTPSTNEFLQWSILPKFIATLNIWKNYNVVPK